MNDDKILCKCCKIFDKKNFTNHFKNCKDFKNEFKDFDLKLSLLLKKYIDIDNLILIKYLFKEYLKLIKHKIKEFKHEIKKSQKETIDSTQKNIENFNYKLNIPDEKSIKNEINKGNNNLGNTIEPKDLFINTNNKEDNSKDDSEQKNNENQSIDKNNEDDKQDFFGDFRQFGAFYLSSINNNNNENNEEQMYSKPNK